MRILITGTNGQVGWELVRSLAPLGELITPSRAEFDLADVDSLDAKIGEIGPDLIVNPAAYTAVDKAETDQENAFRINRDAPAAMARSCALRGIGLIHFSTDYVYPGTGERPWREDDETGPVNVYGRSKLEGEQAIREAECRALIFRTCWVYGARGANFLLTMLRLASEGKSLSIVADQWGAPTSARLIATTVAAVVARTASARDGSLATVGTYHLAAAGETTWHGFAEEIFRLRGELTGQPAPVVARTTADAFKTAAKRPGNSRLSLERIEAAFGLVMPGWREALMQVMHDGASPLGARLAETTTGRSGAVVARGVDSSRKDR